MIDFDMSMLKVADVQEICRPLTDYFDVTTFSYLNIYPDLSRIHLDYHYEWNEYFYQHIDKFVSDDNLTESTAWEPGFSTLHSLDDPCIPYAHLFNIGDGVVIANDLGDCTELCFIGSDPKNEKETVTNLLNNMDLLQKFILYFRGKASNLIQAAKENPIILPNLPSCKSKRKFNFCADNRLKFINSLNDNFTHITLREYECLCLFAKGMSSKDIARKLGVCPKTVDRHFENLKLKHGMKNRVELLALI